MTHPLQPTDAIALPREVVEKALRRAYALGQTYWQQADSDSFSEQRRSNETAVKFSQLVADTCSAPPAPAPEAVDAALVKKAREVCYYLGNAYDGEPRRVIEQLLATPSPTPQDAACLTCSGNGWIGGPSFYAPDEGGEPCPDCNAAAPADAAPPVAEKRKPLTDAQMSAGREAIFSTGNPFCPCDSKTFRKVAEWVERHHGIGVESATLAKKVKP